MLVGVAVGACAVVELNPVLGDQLYVMPAGPAVKTTPEPPAHIVASAGLGRIDAAVSVPTSLMSS